MVIALKNSMFLWLSCGMRVMPGRARTEYRVQKMESKQEEDFLVG